jgi:DNA polymerase-1
MKKALEAFGIYYFTKEGYEADDLIASIASKFQKTNPKSQTIILSGDRDVLQLVDGNIKVQMPGWNMKETTLYGRKEVIAKYGLEPSQMVDYKSLIGDSSDNVPGIAGIGPKTASDLLQRYGDLETLFKRLDEVSEKVRNKLVAGKDTALAAKKLVELDRDVDLELDVDKLVFEPDWNKVRAEYDGLGFKSIANKIPYQKNTEEKETSEPENNQLELI